MAKKNSQQKPLGLNPCFNGIWSRTRLDILSKDVLIYVLILVLMEYGLGRPGDVF